MKSKITLLLVAILFIGLTDSYSQCEKIKKKRIHQILGAAQYDNHRTTDILTSDNTLIEEYQINLYKGVVYKLVFDASKLPEGVVINLYDLGKKRGAGKYEQVFSSASAKKTDDDLFEVTMEFPQRKMLVQYEIPDESKPGCVSFVLGYYFKNNIR